MLALFVLMLFFHGVAAASAVPALSAADELAKLAREYKIEIVAAHPRFPVKTTYGIIEGSAAPEIDLEIYTGLFVAEFGLYPTDLVRRAQLKRVVLCTDLAFAGQRRNAIPDFEHDTLYLEVSRGSFSQPYLRKAMHHEFFHIIDYKDDGSVYQDKRWAALNPSKFHYGTGGINAQDNPETSLLTDKFPGFINHYSTTGVEEDKAELFANLVVDPEYVAGRVADDGVLRAKVAMMKRLLVKFSPAMDERFWQKARELRRNDDPPTGSAISAQRAK